MNLDFQHYPYIGQKITIDENTLFYKSYDIKYKPLKKDRPSFFGSLDNSMKYLDKDRKLGIFHTKKKNKTSWYKICLSNYKRFNIIKKK